MTRYWFIFARILGLAYAAFVMAMGVGSVQLAASSAFAMGDGGGARDHFDSTNLNPPGGTVPSAAKGESRPGNPKTAPAPDKSAGSATGTGHGSAPAKSP
jgi:hypothetical protein